MHEKQLQRATWNRRRFVKAVGGAAVLRRVALAQVNDEVHAPSFEAAKRYVAAFLAQDFDALQQLHDETMQTAMGPVPVKQTRGSAADALGRQKSCNSYSADNSRRVTR